MLPGVGGPAALAIAERQGTALQARFAARRENAAEVTRFREAAPAIADVDRLLGDRRALRLVLEAFQLESEVDKRAMLRRIMTEDPTERTSLAARLADPRWRALANAFTPARALELTPEQVAAQTPEALRQIPLNRIARMTTAQVVALTPQQIPSLAPQQVAAIPPEAIAGLGPQEIAALDSPQVAALTPAQLRGMLGFQLAAIEPRDMAALGRDQLRALTPAQLRSLTTDQLRALQPEQIRAFTAGQAAGFAPGQLDALGPAARTILARADSVPDSVPAATPRRPFAEPALLDKIVQDAMTNRYERAMGEANPGLREALYFRRLAGTVQSIPQLMADRVLTEVVRGALGLPRSFGALSFEQQRDLLTRRLDVADLQDPAQVARMAARYVAQQQAPAAPAALALFQGGGTGALTALAGRRISFSA